jgi:formate hydrogenlyase subunit 6/NADH:ubiquinone oxidoreductase subunit I
MPILINADLCVKGCTLCDQFCPGDIIYRLDPQKLPVIKYEDECWYCGSCEEYCPTDAVKIVFPREMLHSKTQAESLFGKADEETQNIVEAPRKSRAEQRKNP